jgi:acyl-CoA thioester hydrolase
MNSFTWPIRVYYEDTDSGGVVYYANYLKFLERARTEWLRSLGFEQDSLAREANILFIVHSLTLTFSRPARFNDMLEVLCRIDSIKGASLIFEQKILRAGKPAEILCSGRTKVACVHADSLKPRPIPRMITMEILGGN